MKALLVSVLLLLASTCMALEDEDVYGARIAGWLKAQGVTNARYRVHFGLASAPGMDEWQIIGWTYTNKQPSAAAVKASQPLYVQSPEAAKKAEALARARSEETSAAYTNLFGKLATVRTNLQSGTAATQRAALAALLDGLAAMERARLAREEARQ